MYTKLRLGRVVVNNSLRSSSNVSNESACSTRQSLYLIIYRITIELNIELEEAALKIYKLHALLRLHTKCHRLGKTLITVHKFDIMKF